MVFFANTWYFISETRPVWVDFTLIDLDDFDRRLLRALQADGKLSIQELAERAGLSPSPAWRRVRRMEEAGIITGYRALLDRKAIGLSTLAFVHVSLIDHTEASIRIFDSFVETEDQVIECCSITGTDDYMLKIVARDPEALEYFLMKRILGLGIVRSSTTHFVLRQKKYSTALPV